MEIERQDWFSEGWAEDGGVVADGREDETLPPEPEETGKAAPEPEETPQAAPEAEGEAAPEAQGPAAPQGREADFLAFMEAYPQVEPGDIPPEVWRRAAAGESLTAAYARYEADSLRRENAYLRQGQRNRLRSAGSQQGVGAGDRRLDAFDSGWDNAY